MSAEHEYLHLQRLELARWWLLGIGLGLKFQGEWSLLSISEGMQNLMVGQSGARAVLYQEGTQILNGISLTMRGIEQRAD